MSLERDWTCEEAMDRSFSGSVGAAAWVGRGGAGVGTKRLGQKGDIISSREPGSPCIHQAQGHSI